MKFKETSLKRVTQLVAGGTPSVDEPRFWSEESGTPWVTIGDMTGRPTVRQTERRVTEEGIASKRLPVGWKGTVLFAMYASIGTVSVLETEASWNQAILGMEPMASLAEPRFLVYWLLSLRPQLERYFRSNTQDNLNAEQVGNLPYPVLSIEQQRAIADFLDAETARIDALIEKKHHLWQLLLERRAGHIEHAIRGLVAEWGEAPLKYFVREVTVGIVVTPAAWYSETGVPALRGQNVKPGRIILNDLVYLTEEGHGLHKKSELQAGDVVVVRTGQAGAAAVVPAEVAGANCIDLIIVRPGPAVDASFLEHVLNSDWAQKHVEQHSVGTIQSHFNVSAMKELPVPSAPVYRQREVVKHLRRLTDRIDATAARLNRQIELLTEHRQALITAAVTGQVEVPGVAAS